MFFSSTKAFRDKLVTLLQPYLGTMTFANGSVSPAVFVGEPPVDTRVKGLELNIPKLFNGDSEFLTGGSGSTIKFEFTLIQHAGSSQLEQAVAVLLRSLKPISYTYMPAARDPNGAQLTLDQCVFKVSRSALWLN